MIISPDHHLISPTGEYVWTKEGITEAWNKSFSKLHRALASDRFYKLVLMVGVPGSGKSTWLKSNRESNVVYFDATFTTRKERKPVLKAAKKHGKSVEAVVMTTPINVCLDRNRCRTKDRMVPEDILEKMTANLLGDPPTLGEGFDTVKSVR